MKPGKAENQHSLIEQQRRVVSEEPSKRPSIHHSPAGNGKENIPGHIVSEELKSGGSSTSAAGAGGKHPSTNDEHTTTIPGYHSLYMYIPPPYQVITHSTCTCHHHTRLSLTVHVHVKL